MKNVYVIAAVGALSVLAGCSKGADAPADGPVKREAGNWKTDVKLVKFEMPGLPTRAGASPRRGTATARSRPSNSGSRLAFLTPNAPSFCFF